MASETPKFKSDEEFIAWAFENISTALRNLTDRVEKLEIAIQKIPPPGAEMMKYRPEGKKDYLNMKELFDDIYSADGPVAYKGHNIKVLEDRLNKLEDHFSQ
jgi:hypothetical protein|tara:strand:- start:1446 stop:1751 length:306 start_codon:yes stop_codon:yes gene_type:complete